MPESTDLLQYLEAQKSKQLDSAREIAAKAKGEARGLKPDESEAAEAHMRSAGDFDEKIKAIRDADKLEAAVNEMSAMMATEPPEVTDVQHGRSLGEAFVASQGFKAIQETASHGTGSVGRFTTQAVEVLMGRERMGATTGTILGTDGTNNDGIPVNFLPGLYTPGLRQQPLTLAALFAQGQTDQPVVQYQTAKTRTPPASHGVTAEGAAKQVVDFAFDKATVTLAKLTAFVKISEEMVSDSPAIRDYINAQLPLMVRQDEEYKLATEIYAAAHGTGGGGFVTDADLSGVNGFDAIAAGINAIQSVAFFEPDGLFIHPDDFWSLRVVKSAVSGDYYSGGPYASPSSNPWGLRAVVSNMAPVGFPMVGAFSTGGQVWRKGGVSVDATNSNEDDFKKDLIAIRAEQRIGLAVYYPEAFAIVNLAS